MRGKTQRVVLAGDASIPASRRRVRAWLEAVSWPSAQIDDVVYAVNEAVSNAVEHAYTADDRVRTVELSFHVEHAVDRSRRARVQVGDHGRWSPPVPRVEYRGFGLILMRALMDEVTVGPREGRRGGTMTILLSRPAPAVAG